MKQRAAPRLDQRSAGILLHVTSLPGPHGSGDLGAEAHAFVASLAAAGQRWWQMLPVGPGDAPYSSTSAFAGNPSFVALRPLYEEGLLDAADLRPGAGLRADRVTFPAVNRFREMRLRKAAERFLARRGSREKLARFASEQRAWLDDYVLFAALRCASRGRPWTEWDARIRDRRPAALTEARRALADEIDYRTFVQYAFDRQWRALRAETRLAGVGLIGDVPIFVSHDSADVWSRPELFQLRRDGRPKVVSGCPPDMFSDTGQLWGHALYDWLTHASDGFSWWIERFRATLARFDAARIDHFLGFHRCYAIPGGAKTAERGSWQYTPGDALFAAVRKRLGPVPLIAEDLGAVTPEATALRDRLELPGMRILQNGFYDGARFDQPHNYVRNCVAYTGTHDNETIVGWFRNLQRRRKRGKDGLTDLARLERYAGAPVRRDAHWTMLRLLLASPANLAIAPLQDVLGLDNRSRMNTPATTRGNWAWRMTAGAFTAALAERLRSMLEAYER